MRAIQFASYGPIDQLHLCHVPEPAPSRGEILVQVMAAAVNPADVKWRGGMFRDFAPVALPHVLGYDVAGIVAALGDDTTGFTLGDRVTAMLDPMTKGGYAEFATVTAGAASPIPSTLDFDTAAAIPCAGLTGVQGIEDPLHGKAGQSVLITGATGAVGRFAVFAALRMGMRVAAAVRASYRDEAASLGASAVIALDEDWQGAPFDYVFDTIGGPAVAKLCRHLVPGGQIGTVATTPIDQATLPATPVFITVRQDGQRLAALAHSVASGKIEVPVAHRFKLDSACEAHRLMEAGGLRGKIILRPWD